MEKASEGLKIENNMLVDIGVCHDTTVVVPEGVDVVVNFGKAPFVREVYLPDSVTEVYESAFYGCTKLRKLSMGKNVKRLNDFYPAALAKSFELQYRGALADWCKTEIDSRGLNSYVELFVNGERVCGTVVIPDGVEAIKDNAFNNLNAVDDLVLPNSIKRIGSNVIELVPDDYDEQGGWFYGGGEEKYVGNEKNPTLALIGTITMDNQEWYDEWDGGRYRQIEVLDGCKVIADGVFLGCDNIYEVLIPEGVVTIGDYAFAGCAALERIVIPSTLEYLGQDALADCGKLKKIEFKGTKAQWLKIEGSAGVAHKVTCSDGEI